MEVEFAPLEVWEKRKIDAADIVLCASQIIYDATVQKHSDVMLIRNAADYDPKNEKMGAGWPPIFISLKALRHS